MAENSRAEYFRKRRQEKKQLVFMIDRQKAEKLDDLLKSRGEGRTEWLRRKIDEEIGEK